MVEESAQNVIRSNVIKPHKHGPTSTLPLLDNSDFILTIWGGRRSRERIERRNARGRKGRTLSSSDFRTLRLNTHTLQP